MAGDKKKEFILFKTYCVHFVLVKLIGEMYLWKLNNLRSQCERVLCLWSMHRERLRENFKMGCNVSGKITVLYSRIRKCKNTIWKWWITLSSIIFLETMLQASLIFAIYLGVPSYVLGNLPLLKILYPLNSWQTSHNCDKTKTQFSE